MRRSTHQRDRGMSRVVCWIVAGALAGFAGSLRAQGDASAPLPANLIGGAQALELVAIRPGIDQCGKVGQFLPLDITLRSAVSTLEHLRLRVITADPEGVPCEWETDRTWTLEAGQDTPIRLGFRPGRLDGVISVEAQSEGQLVGKWMFPPTIWREFGRSTREWVLVLGNDISMSLVPRLRPRDEARRMLVSRLADPAQLPEDVRFLEGVDVIVLTTGDADKLAAIPKATWRVLEDYAEGGGRLILSCGRQGEALFKEDGPLRRLLRSGFIRVRRQRDTTGLEGFAGTADRLDLVGSGRSDPGGELLVAQLGPIRGRLDAYDGSGDQQVAWVIRERLGFGALICIATDLELGPVADWGGRPRLLARLLDLALGTVPDDTRENESPSGSAGQLGFRDLAGQLRVALDRFRGVEVIPFSTVLLVAAASVGLLAGADFLLVRFLFRAPWWTWVSFPTMAALMCGGMVAVAQRSKGDRTRTTELEIVDFDFAAGIIRGNVWSRVFTPRPVIHDFRLQVDGTPLPSTPPRWSGCEWDAPPGTVTGGLDSMVRAVPMFNAYRQTTTTDTSGAARTDILGIGFPQWGSRGFHGYWRGDVLRRPTPELTAGTAGTLSGSFVNPLPWRLRDCVLYHSRWAYELGALAAGGEVAIDRDDIPKDVVSRLTRRKIVNLQEVTSPWNPEGIDIPRIAEMMMFHEAAGGEGYTGLQHRYLRSLEASDLLDLETAILVGRVDTSFAALSRDGVAPRDTSAEGDQRWGFVRIYMAVTGTAKHE